MRARPFAERDLADLRAFAAAELGLEELQPWDYAWASEKLKEARYSFSEQEIKQYFTAPKVLAGLFKIIETLFEVVIRRVDAKWKLSQNRSDADVDGVIAAVDDAVATVMTEVRDGGRA